MKWTLVAGIFLLVMVAGAIAPADATITLGFVPSSQTVTVGNPFTVDLAISGLGSGGAPSLGAFDLDVTFNPAILGFTSAVFGDPVLGDQLDLAGFGTLAEITPSAGFVNLFELSFDDVKGLNTLQASSFVLARLTFDPLSVGSSWLTFSINALSDAEGVSLSDVKLGEGNVNAVPEPATILLLSSGLAGLGIATWKRRRRR